MQPHFSPLSTSTKLRRRRPAILASIASALIPVAAFSADAIRYWDAITNSGDAPTNSNFYNATNWDGDVRPTFTGNTDSIVFNGAGAGVTIPLTINAGMTEFLVKSITFEAGAYTFGNSQNLTFGDETNLLSNTGNLTNNSTGTQAFNTSGIISFRFGTINAAAGAISFGNSTTLNIGYNSNDAGRTLHVDGSFNVTVNSVLAGTGTETSAGGDFIKNGSGTLFLQGDSSNWNGRITINSGVVEINKNTSLGSAEGRTTISGGDFDGRLNLKAGISVAENFYLEGRNTIAAPHLVNLSGSNLISGAIKLQAGGTNFAIVSSAGTFTIGGDISYDTVVGDTNLRLGGNGTGVINGQIGAGGAPISIIKNGSGTWTLNAANEFTGSITIAAGTLNLTTAHTGEGAISVSDSSTLGVTVAGAGQTLVTSSLSLGSLDGSTLVLDTGAVGGSSDPLIQALAFSTAGLNTISIKASGAPLGIGVFPLISYTGTIGGAGFEGLQLGSLPARVTAELVDDALAGIVALNVSAFDIPKWTGAFGTDWDIDNGTGTGTENWQEVASGNVTRYLQGAGGTDSVLFDDSAPEEARSVNLTATLTPVAVTVNTDATYTFGGAGKLSGPARLVKEGEGTLIIVNAVANDYTGTTVISDGVLQIGDGITSGLGSIGGGGITNNGLLRLSRPDAFAINGAISGSGSIEKFGQGTTTLSGNSTFDGEVTVWEGTLRLGNNNALGSVAGATIVKSGATLDINARTLPQGEEIRIEGTGVFDAGALVNNGGGAGGMAGPRKVVLIGDASIGGTGRFDIRDQAGGLDAAGFKLTKVGANNVVLGNIGETHLGDVVISSGRLAFEANTTMGDHPGVIRVETGGQLGFEDSTVVHTKGIVLDRGTLIATLGSENTIAGPVTLEGVSSFQTSGNATLTVSGPIGGTGGFTKTVGGLLVLTGDNTYEGVTTLSQGTLWVGNGGATGTLGSGVFSFEPGASASVTLAFRRTDTALVVANDIISPGIGTHTITIGLNSADYADAIVTFSGNNEFTGNVTINGGGLRITNSNALGWGPKTISIASGSTPNLRLDGSAGSITLPADFTFTTSNDNATTPAILNEAGDNVIESTIALTGGGGGQTRIRTDAGRLTLAGDILPGANVSTNRTLILDGVAEGTVSGVISDNTRTLSVTKAGSGTWTLAGENSYSGSTTIQAGTLKVGSTGALGASPLVNISGTAVLDVTDVAGFTLGNGQTLTGTGTVLGNVASGVGSTISPASDTTAGTLRFDNDIIFAGGGTVRTNIGATSDLISVQGNVNVTGRTKVRIDTFGTALSGGYQFIEYNGELTGDLSNFTAIHDTRYIFSFEQSSPQQVQIAVSGSAGSITWSGDGAANIWDLNTAANWDNGTEKFYQSDTVTFTNGTPNTSITLATALHPYRVLVDSESDYSFVGSGSISGAPGGLYKAGSGTLTITTANSYTGPTEVEGGLLLVQGSITGSRLTVRDGGTIGGTGSITTSNQPFTLELGGKLSPGGEIAGVLTVNTANSRFNIGGAVSEDASGALLFQLGDPSASDRLSLTNGILDIGEGFLAFDDFSFEVLPGFTFGTYTLFSTNRAISGFFDPNPGAVSGIVGGFEATLEFGDNGTDVLLVVVPEPGSFGALLASVTLLSSWRLRRRPAGEKSRS